MLKLSKSEISYIKATVSNNLIHWYGVFTYYFSNEAIQKYWKTKEVFEKEISLTNSIFYQINKNNTIDKETKEILSKIQEEKIKEFENKQDSNYYEDLIISNWIKTWFRKNLIIQVKRPDTFWNSWDYTWDEKIDEEYRKNQIFVKFQDWEEYQQYEEIFTNWGLWLYRVWFEENKNKFTIISI